MKITKKLLIGTSLLLALATQDSNASSTSLSAADFDDFGQPISRPTSVSVKSTPVKSSKDDPKSKKTAKLLPKTEDLPKLKKSDTAKKEAKSKDEVTMSYLNNNFIRSDDLEAYVSSVTDVLRNKVEEVKEKISTELAGLGPKSEDADDQFVTQADIANFITQPEDSDDEFVTTSKLNKIEEKLKNFAVTESDDAKHQFVTAEDLDSKLENVAKTKSKESKDQFVTGQVYKLQLDALKKSISTDYALKADIANLVDKKAVDKAIAAEIAKVDLTGLAKKNEVIAPTDLDDAKKSAAIVTKLADSFDLKAIDDSKGLGAILKDLTNSLEQAKKERAAMLAVLGDGSLDSIAKLQAAMKAALETK